MGAAQDLGSLLTISLDERIENLLLEIGRHNLPVLLRFSENGKIVRGFIEQIDEDNFSILVGGISKAGDNALKSYDVLHVETVFLSAKLVFKTSVRGRSAGKIILSRPEKITVIERRNTRRFAVPLELAIFADFLDIRFAIGRLDSPIVSIKNRSRPFAAPHLRIDELGMGGFAVVTRFPAALENLKQNGKEHKISLLFPKSEPIVSSVTVRWVKKTTNALDLSDGHGKLDALLKKKLKADLKGKELTYKESYYRAGLMFSHVSKELDAALRNHIELVISQDYI